MLRITALLFLAAMVSSNVQADVNAEIVERIKKVGSVCIAGAECKPELGAASVVAEVAPAATQAVSFVVEDTYNKTCAVCHNTGAAGAPKLGDTVQWSARIDKGIDVLYASSINGMPPAMPAKGMCFSCSDDDLRALVDYMVESLQP